MKLLDLSSLLSVPELGSYLMRTENYILASVGGSSQHIRIPLRQVIGANSKRLRPALLVAAASSNGAKINDDILQAGAAIEMVHLGSLVHDDLIDGAQARHNKPTINETYGDNQALVGGDYLLAKAGYLAAGLNTETAQIIGAAITSLCEGQAQELADQYDMRRPRDSIFKAVEGKTASLISAACELGALWGGLGKTQQLALANYGRAFGMSYQLIDDLLDILSTPKLLGKPTMADINQGVYTLPIVDALQESDTQDLRAILGNNAVIEQEDTVDLLLAGQGISKSVSLIKQYNQQAVEALEGLGSSKVLKGMRALPNHYLDWAFGTLVAKSYRQRIEEILRTA